MINRCPVIPLCLQLVNVSILGKKDKFYQQNEGVVMGNSLFLVVSNIFMEHFEEIALDTADHKPTTWLICRNTFVVWSRGPARLQQFLHHLNSVRHTIKFTMEVETNDTLPFLEVLVMKRGPKLAMKVYQKSTRIGCYLHFKSNHPHHIKRGVVHSSISQAKIIYQDQNDFNNEIKT
jgi:hypothetical protein